MRMWIGELRSPINKIFTTMLAGWVNTHGVYFMLEEDLDNGTRNSL